MGDTNNMAVIDYIIPSVALFINIWKHKLTFLMLFV